MGVLTEGATPLTSILLHVDGALSFFALELCENNGWEPIPGAGGAEPGVQPKTLWYMQDALGSTIGLVEKDGRVSSRYHYDEFGVPLDAKKFDLNWPGPDNLFGYTGLGYDFASSNTYARARYYKPEIGRFISEDTYKGQIDNPQSLNLYTYVENNPIMYVDPSGHRPIVEDPNEPIDTVKKSVVGFGDSTIALIKQLEGTPFLTPRINDNGTITIGYGYDFTEKDDPDMFNKYLTRNNKGKIVVRKNLSMTEKEAEATIKPAADKKGITKALTYFMNGTGAGNTTASLSLNQNQYDALFSYLYSSGAGVFTNSKYAEWNGYGGEYASRAKARIRLRDYIINNNGNYDSETIVNLFIKSKGANIKYDYRERRMVEAKLFAK